MTLTSVGLALKLPPASHAVLIGKGAKPLRYFPTGQVKKDYVVVPRPMASDVDALAPWRAFSSPRPFPKRAGQEQSAADLRNSGLRLRAERIVPEVILSGGVLGCQDRVGLASREPGRDEAQLSRSP